MRDGELRAAAAGAGPLHLLLPVTREAFFAEHWERAPLVSSAGDRRRFDALLTLQAVDAFLASADLRHDMLRLVLGGDPVDPARYVAPDGRVQPAAVAEAYLRGATIVLPQLHLSLAPVAYFCRGLQGEFSATVQANAYLTPAGARGFDPHYDQHDVFILQIHGAKKWRLYATPAAAASGAPFERGRHEAGDVTSEWLLNPGDCLYIPRGLMHEAANDGNEPSLHLTIGILATRWGQVVLDAVTALVRDDPAFQRALPPGFATQADARGTANDQFATLLDKLGGETRLDEALDRAALAFLAACPPDITGVLACPRPHGPLRRRPRLLWRLDAAAGDLVLTGPGGEMLFSRPDEAALTMALSGEAFEPALLPSPDPPRLVERLWANGYLEQAG